MTQQFTKADILKAVAELERAQVVPFCDAAMDAEMHLTVEFGQSYDGKICAVCRSKKWPSSPFCKKCSIRLQRAHMMERMQAIRKSFGKGWRSWPQEFVILRSGKKMRVGTYRWFMVYWDICKDFLINSRKQKKRSEDDDGSDAR